MILLHKLHTCKKNLFWSLNNKRTIFTASPREDEQLKWWFYTMDRKNIFYVIFKFYKTDMTHISNHIKFLDTLPPFSCYLQNTGHHDKQYHNPSIALMPHTAYNTINFITFLFVIFWVTAPCSPPYVYQCYEAICRLSIISDKVCAFLHNAGITLQNYTVSKRRRIYRV